MVVSGCRWAAGYCCVEHVAQDGDSDECGDRGAGAHSGPGGLCFVELGDGFPFLVFPGPFVAFEQEDEGHDESYGRDEAEQCDVGVVADAPDPAEEESAPVEPFGLRRKRCAGSDAGVVDEAA